MRHRAQAIRLPPLQVSQQLTMVTADCRSGEIRQVISIKIWIRDHDVIEDGNMNKLVASFFQILAVTTRELHLRIFEEPGAEASSAVWAIVRAASEGALTATPLDPGCDRREIHEVKILGEICSTLDFFKRPMRRGRVVRL
ncbi:hypothetical protein ASF55_17510 [Methylobacterium sp. Leaf119]|nr:hypothetical protein ASF55_17510 [Methylobacterium sp. Leaf119]